MKLIRTEDAVGSVLCHDITQIIPGVVKDAVFRKGHVVTEEDVPVLLSVGKEHLYVWEKQEGMLHENDAAEVLRQVCQRVPNAVRQLLHRHNRLLFADQRQIDPALDVCAQ